MLDIENQYLYQEAIGYKYSTASAGWPEDDTTNVVTTATPKTTEVDAEDK